MNLKELISGSVRTFPEKPSNDPRDIKCARFSPEQTEVIVASDYSLVLFHALRVESLSIEQIVEKFPEPEEGKARTIIDRLMELKIVKRQGFDKYVAVNSGDFPNFTDHKYDCDLEAEKDTKIFATMKEFAGIKEYWKTQSYFSADGFFTDEQTQEIKKMLLDVKFFVKNALKANEESGKIEGMIFRRHKFYDMVLSLIAFVLILGSGEFSQAGNDPGTLKGNQEAQLSPAMDSRKIIEKLLANPKRFASNDPGIYSRASYSVESHTTGDIEKQCALEVWLSGENWQNISTECQEVILRTKSDLSSENWDI